MAAKPYIPPDYEATVQKYAAPVVLKGIVRRYLRVYEKGLPLRIYTFVAAEKYFLEDAYAVYRREEEKIVSQMTALFHALKKFGKFDGRFDPAKGAFGSRARWAAMRRTICWRSRTRPAKRAIRNGNLRASSTSTRKSTGSANVPMPVDNESVFPARKNADV
jgi:hypothetical protein